MCSGVRALANSIPLPTTSFFKLDTLFPTLKLGGTGGAVGISCKNEFVITCELDSITHDLVFQAGHTFPNIEIGGHGGAVGISCKNEFVITCELDSIYCLKNTNVM